MSYEDWLDSLPDRLISDPLWNSIGYRKSMYLFDLVWQDGVHLKGDPRSYEIMHQLIRSSGSVCANMEEAYGRGVGTRDYVRIMRIALGEAHETQGWYIRARHTLPTELIEQRLDLINEVISLLVTTIKQQTNNITKS